MLQDFPQKFNEGEAATKYAPRLDESMNIILLQELARYNKLISVIRSSLSNFKDALNGVILFSFDLEEALNFIKIGKVPKMWMDQSYPSLKPLGGYLKNLIERIKFYRTWIENGIPSLFWLSGFFFPQGFLTGILQNYARKYTIAIDKLKFGFEVNSRLTAKVKEEKFDTSVKPEDGAYLNGFYLEGARFSYDEMSLAESHSKVLPCLILRYCSLKVL